jgi:PAS domain S-box-containing protein
MFDSRKPGANQHQQPQGSRCGVEKVMKVQKAGPSDDTISVPETDYRAIFDAANDAIFVHDLKTGRIIDVNQKMSEMYGYGLEEAKTIHIGDVSAGSPPYSEDEALYWIKRARKDGPQLFEWQAKDKSGKLFWVEVNLKHAKIGGRNRILAIVRDITERKQNQILLQKERDSIFAVLEKAPYGAVLIDHDGKYLYVNPQFIAITGYTLDDIPTRWAWLDKAYPEPDYREMVREIWDADFTQGTESRIFRVTCKNGTVKQIEFRPTFLDDGTAAMILYDITEQIKAEEELRYSKEALRTIIDSVYDGIFIHELDGTVIDVNNKILELYGISRDQVSRLTIQNDYSSMSNPLHMLPVTWKKVISGETAFFEWKAKRPNDGLVFDVEVFLRKLSLLDKDVILANVRDITERKKAEKALAEEKQKFETLAINAPFGMIMIESSGAFNYVNPKFMELFGYDLSDVPNIGTWLRMVYSDYDQRQTAERKWFKIVADMKLGERRPFTRQITCKDHTKKTINFIPVRLVNGEVLITCEDITQRQLAEQEIKLRNVELTALNHIISAINSALNLPGILDTLRQVFSKQLKIPVGGIFLYDELSGMMNMELSWGVTDAKESAFRTSAMEAFQDEQLLSHKEVILNTRISFTSHHQNSLCIPIVFKEELKGIIFLAVNQRSNGFSNDRLPLMRTLGQQIGVAIKNAQLYEQLKASNEQMQALSRQLVEVQESERRSIARELHDEIGQILTALKVSLGTASGLSNDKSERRILQAQQLCQKLIVTIRELSLKLRPQMLDDLGLLPTLLWHFQHFQNQTHIRVDFKHSDIDERFSQEVETAVYRIVQEALTNVVRHAGVKEVTVRIWLRGNTLGVQVEDRGRGFDSTSILKSGMASGLTGMRERALLLGGQFVVESSHNIGTRLIAELPVR